MIPKRRAGPFIFYINALPLFYINWSVHVPVEISVLFVTVLWKIFSTYTSISFFFSEEEGGTISLLTVTILLHKESLKWFNALFPPPKIYYLLNKELLLVIKRLRFEYLSLGMSVFNKHCISLPVCKSKDILFLSYSYTSLKSVKPIFFLFWLLIYFFKYINNWIYASF